MATPPLQAQRPHWLSFWGLHFANGLVHTLGGITEGAYNTGLWSAAFLIIPLSIWVLYATTIRGPYSGKVVAVSFVCGAVTHALLFIGHGLFKSGIIGSAGLLVYAAVIGFTPIILAALGSRFFKPPLLRPVPRDSAPVPQPAGSRPRIWWKRRGGGPASRGQWPSY